MCAGFGELQNIIFSTFISLQKRLALAMCAYETIFGSSIAHSFRYDTASVDLSIDQKVASIRSRADGAGSALRGERIER